MPQEKVYRAIGLMSGTSLDGVIDVALIETDGHDYVKPLGFYEHPYDIAVRDQVRSCFGKRARGALVDEAEALVTQAHIAAVRDSGFLPDADIIGFHGQTITHAPEDGFTWQLGDGARMAQALGVYVVNDFRSADVAAGGQGAPLAPLYHRAIMAGEDRRVAVLNLGGVGNVSVINEGDILAFDSGPANALMDDYALAHFDVSYDEGGAIAAKGRADMAVVEAFLAQGYFAAAPPKSLDRNAFDAVVKALPSDPHDAMATLLQLTVRSVVAAVDHCVQPPEIWYLCGGGAKNGGLVNVLSDALAPAVVRDMGAAGYDGDAIEAQAFAYLAVRSLLGLPISLPETTGVARAMTGGIFHSGI